VVSFFKYGETPAMKEARWYKSRYTKVSDRFPLPSCSNSTYNHIHLPPSPCSNSIYNRIRFPLSCIHTAANASNGNI